MKSKLEKEVEKAIGIGRKERLLEHFRVLEEKTQKKCRITRRFDIDFCPLANYAPARYKHNGTSYWLCFNRRGYVLISREHPELSFEGDIVMKYKIYSILDSDWWESLPYSSQRLVNLWLEEYFRERKKKG